jgi:hypothetical protein
MVSKYGLSQHVSAPTQLKSGLLLDLINACHVIPGISDHEAVLFEVDQTSK